MNDHEANIFSIDFILGGGCWYLTHFSSQYRDFYGYFTLLMSDNVGVRLISLFTTDFHKTSDFQWTLGPLGQRLSAFWLTLPCYSCWRNMWMAPYYWVFKVFFLHLQTKWHCLCCMSCVQNKFALLWGEAQLWPIVTLCWPIAVSLSRIINLC